MPSGIQRANLAMAAKPGGATSRTRGSALS